MIRNENVYVQKPKPHNDAATRRYVKDELANGEMAAVYSAHNVTASGREAPISEREIQKGRKVAAENQLEEHARAIGCTSSRAFTDRHVAEMKAGRRARM
jgi:hypothetical protein